LAKPNEPTTELPDAIPLAAATGTTRLRSVAVTDLNRSCCTLGANETSTGDLIIDASARDDTVCNASDVIPCCSCSVAILLANSQKTSKPTKTKIPNNPQSYPSPLSLSTKTKLRLQAANSML
jgi:hypothetical protein